MNSTLALYLLNTLIFGFLAIYFSFKEEKAKQILKKQDEQQRQKIYQIEILKEIQDKIGYSLDLEKVIDVITGSLRNFFSYSTVSSIVIKEDKLVFKIRVEEGVDKGFISAVKKSMLASLTSLLRTLPANIEEVITGAPLKNSGSTLASFFHIPLIVANKVVGLISIASTKNNLYKEEEMTILYQITGQASNALTRLQEVLLSEEEKREDLTNMLVHELRAPLTAIKDSASVLAADASTLEKQEGKRLLDIIHEQAKILLNQIGEILDAAKLEAGKLAIVKKPQENIVEVIKKSLIAFASQAAKKQITLALEGSYELPLSSFDPIRIGQAINNLLSNSLKFTPSGGKIILKTELIGNLSGKYIKISITDTGVGIPLEKQKYLFTKYSKASERRGSTGLGLYVVKGIVEGHGGSVACQSEPGKGTTISFTLPLEEKPEAKQKPEQTSQLSRQLIN